MGGARSVQSWVSHADWSVEAGLLIAFILNTSLHQLLPSPLFLLKTLLTQVLSMSFLLLFLHKTKIRKTTQLVKMVGGPEFHPQNPYFYDVRCDSVMCWVGGDRQTCEASLVYSVSFRSVRALSQKEQSCGWCLRNNSWAVLWPPHTFLHLQTHRHTNAFYVPHTLYTCRHIDTQMHSVFHKINAQTNILTF